MKKLVIVVGMVVGLMLIAGTTVQAGDFRFPFGLTYISGANKVVDQLKANLEEEGYEVESTGAFPVGLSLQPYYEFNNGLGIGVGAGPVLLVFGDRTLTDVPLNLCLRYAMLPKAKVTPYIRAGVSTHIASGDYVEGSQAGFVGAFGLEFMRNRAVSIGIEAGYDSATIEMENSTTANPNDRVKIEPIGFMVSIFAVF